MRFMPRFFIILMLIILGGAAALYYPFYKTSPDILKERFSSEVLALIGEKTQVKSASLTFFPTPLLTLTDVKIGENEWLKADGMSIDLGFLGLWSNSLSKYNLTFNKAVIDDVAISEKALERLKLLMQLESSQLFGKITFENSEFTLKTPLQEITLTDFDGVLSFEKTTSPFKLIGTAISDDEKISFEVKVDKPQAAFIANKTSPLSVKINNNLGVLSLMSEASFTNGLAFKGTLVAKKDDVLLKANSEYAANRLSLNQIELKGKGLEGEGALVIEPLSKRIVGTLSFDELTLAKTVDTSATSNISALQEFIPTANKLMPLAFIDLRLSVKKLHTQKHILEDVSAIVLGKSENITLSSLNFKIKDSIFKGEAKLNQQGFNLALTGQNVGFMSLFPAMKIDAKGDIALNLLMNDQTLPYKTDLKFALKEGLAHYGNLDDRLLEAVRRPLSRANVALSNGSTRFQSLKGQVSFDSTRWAVTETLVLDTPRLIAHIEGGGEDEKLSIKGHSRLKALGLEMPYTVTGLIKEPRLSFAPQDVINRSPATKPLREGARDESAINAVRDIMNRQAPNMAPSEMPNLPLPLRLP